MTENSLDDEIMLMISESTEANFSVLSAALAIVEKAYNQPPKKNWFRKVEQGDNATMMTTAGSPNHRLWRKMAERGYLVEQFDEKLSNTLMVLFGIVKERAPEIRDLIVRSREKYASQRIVNDILQEIAFPALAKIVDKVAATTRQNQDTLIVLAAMNAQVIRAMQPDHPSRIQILDALSNTTKSMLERELH
jgi:hypothetical protein